MNPSAKYLRPLLFPLLLILLADCAQFDAEGSYLGLFLTGGSAAGGGSATATSTVETTSPVKLVQSGTQTMTANTETTTLGTAVDMAASMLLCYGWTSTSNPDYIASCRLSATNQITFDTQANNSQEITWHLAEFASGASVQRGSEVMAAGSTTSNIAITAVDLSKSFAIVTTQANVGTTTDERRTVTARLTSTTNLELARNESGNAVTIEWQVVQLDGATVQSGDFNFTGTSNAVTVSTLDPATSVLLFSARADAATNGVDNQYFARGTITDATTLTFTRENATNSVDIAWFAIDINGSTVQSGTASDVDPNHLTLNGTLSTAIDTSLSVPIISTSLTASGTGDLDGGSYSAAFSTTTNLFLKRQGPDGANATVDWFALQLPTQ